MPCEWAAKRLRGRPVSRTVTLRRARASCRAAAGPAKLPPLMMKASLGFRSTPVRFFVGAASLSLPASIRFLLPFQFLDNNVQLVEACGPELAITLDPCRLFFQSAQPELAGPHAPNLLCADKP